MKNYSLTFLGVVVLALAFFAATFVGNKLGINPSIASGYQTAEGDNAVPKRDSFTTKKDFSAQNDSSDTLKTMVVRGKVYLLTQIDNRLKQLEPFKTKVENIVGLNEPDRDSLVSELNSEIDLFKAYKTEINQSETKEDIRTVADKVKTVWLKSRLSVNRANTQILALRENQLMSDAETASLSIKKRIDTLKASGKNTKANEKLFSEYSKMIASAKQTEQSANEKAAAVASAATDAEKEKLNNEKALLTKNAHDDIKEAYKLVAAAAREDFRRRFK